MIGFGKNDTLRIGFRFGHQSIYKIIVDAQTLTQLRIIPFPIRNRILCHATIHCRFCHRRSHRCQQSWIHRLRNNILGTKTQVLFIVCHHHTFRHGLHRQICNRTDSSEFHFFIDLRCSYIECTSENKRKSQHVIHLIRVIRSSRCHDQIRTRRHRQMVIDFRRRICHREDNWLFRHRQNHFRS